MIQPYQGTSSEVLFYEVFNFSNIRLEFQNPKKTNPTQGWKNEKGQFRKSNPGLFFPPKHKFLRSFRKLTDPFSRINAT